MAILMEVRYYEPSKDFNKAVYNAPFNLLLLPLGTDGETEKKIILNIRVVQIKSVIQLKIPL